MFDNIVALLCIKLNFLLLLSKYSQKHVEESDRFSEGINHSEQIKCNNMDSIELTQQIWNSSVTFSFKRFTVWIKVC